LASISATSQQSAPIGPPVTSATSLPYVLITPARNEEAFLGDTIQGVLSQTVVPARWVIVDDRSTDRTAEIVRGCLPAHPFIRLLSLPGDGSRSFGKKAAAFNAGLELLDGIEYGYIGNLDADIKLPPGYYESVLREFERDPSLGVAGGTVFTLAGGLPVRLDAAADSVPGAVQLFRKECFRDIGGKYLLLEQGGIDAAAEVMARMHGWEVRQIPGVSVQEQRRIGTAADSDLAAKYKEGVRFHSLGYGTLYYLVRAIYKMQFKPKVIGSLIAVVGFLVARVTARPISLPPEVVAHLQAEQKRKLLTLTSGLFRGKWRFGV